MSEARQIQSMIDFIEREAQEKAEEVDAAAQEEYDIEKMRLIEAEKAKIRSALDKRKKQVDIDRRVARANYSKTQRLRVMDTRAKTMDALHEHTHKRILDLVANPTAYTQLLRSLIQQSLLAVRTDAVVQCRKEDEARVRQMVPELEQWYRETTSESASVQVAGEYLNAEEVWGGVVMASSDGRIICNNTLAYRAKTCFDEQLPAIRYYLFNAEAPM